MLEIIGIKTGAYYNQKFQIIKKENKLAKMLQENVQLNKQKSIGRLNISNI